MPNEKVIEQVSQEVETTVQETEKQEVDVDIEKRIKSEVSKAQHKLLQDLGISNVKEGKELLTKAKENEEYKPFKEQYETLNVKYEELEKETNDLRIANEYNEVSVKLLGENFNPERLESIKPLLNGEGTVEEKVERIKNQLPELFLKPSERRSTIPQEEDVNLTEAQKYFQQRRKQRI